MCPPFSQMGSVWFKKNSWELPKYPKARFQKRGAEGRKRSAFPPALPIMSPKEGISLGCVLWEVSEEAGWIDHASLLWSGALVAIQTQINRGGTLELMTEEGGWRRVRRRAVRSIAPEPWKVKDRCALRTLPDPAPDGTPTPFLSLLQTSFPRSTSFSAKLSAWLHEKFHGLGTWKTFQRRFIGARRLCSYGGLLTYSGTFGSQSLG